MAFRVGQKVVFVAGVKVDRPLGKKDWPAFLTNGTIVTIRDIDTRYVASFGICGLRFEEYHHPEEPAGRFGMVEPCLPIRSLPSCGRKENRNRHGYPARNSRPREHRGSQARSRAVTPDDQRTLRKPR